VRLLYVVQRYGREVAGGAETHCREFATRLAARGHDVEVLTTCAASHAGWANFYAEGSSTLDGVPVHRLAVARPRDDHFFARIDERVMWGVRPAPLHLQQRWIELLGPLVPGLAPWLAERAGGFDAVIFFTYIFPTTWSGLPVASALAPTVLHPTAHDEPALDVRLYDLTFRHPSGFAFSTEEESALVARRFGPPRRQAVIGIGADLDARARADEARFRADSGVGDRPYVVYVGRVEGGKGAVELFDWFGAYKRRRPGPLALVMVGAVIDDPGAHPDVVMTGFVDDDRRTSALAGAVALVQPSYYESFSMVLTEAWAVGIPALVQGHCAVLEGQVRRSGGGIPYRGYAEFEAALDRVLADPDLRRAMGDAGRRYTEANYRWDTVLGRYEEFLSEVVAAADSATKS